jgi:hypothetical protein
MTVYVNNEPVHLLPGMTVRNALIQADLLNSLKDNKRVYDEWGNEIGLDGAIYEKMKIFVR